MGNSAPMDLVMRTGCAEGLGFSIQVSIKDLVEVGLCITRFKSRIMGDWECIVVMEEHLTYSVYTEAKLRGTEKWGVDKYNHTKIKS